MQGSERAPFQSPTTELPPAPTNAPGSADPPKSGNEAFLKELKVAYSPCFRQAAQVGWCRP